jgi:hypothetical protein
VLVKISEPGARQNRKTLLYNTYIVDTVHLLTVVIIHEYLS